jgi:hypothetical protein
MADHKTRDVAGILRLLTPQQMAEEIVRLDAVIAGRASTIRMGRLPDPPTGTPSDAPGAWTCSRCGFRGFWSGGPHECAAGVPGTVEMLPVPQDPLTQLQVSAVILQRDGNASGVSVGGGQTFSPSHPDDGTPEKP